MLIILFCSLGFKKSVNKTEFLNFLSGYRWTSLRMNHVTSQWEGRCLNSWWTSRTLHSRHHNFALLLEVLLGCFTTSLKAILQISNWKFKVLEKWTQVSRKTIFFLNDLFSSDNQTFKPPILMFPKDSRLKGKVMAETVRDPLSLTSGAPGSIGHKVPSTYSLWISSRAACLVGI